VKAEIPVHTLTKAITFKITGMGVQKARWALAAQIFRLGGWIAGSAVEIETVARKAPL
jgi:hypothetical protein